MSHSRGGERAREHLSFKRDIDHARAFRKQTTERCEHEWSRQSDRRGNERKGENVSHDLRSQTWQWRSSLQQPSEERFSGDKENDDALEHLHNIFRDVLGKTVD